MKINYKSADEFRKHVNQNGFEFSNEKGFMIYKGNAEAFIEEIIYALEASEKDVERYAGSPNACLYCHQIFPIHAGFCPLK